ncbi:SufE family protein [Candidatus Similichlamydia laticola]|uniref:Sulfur acceptor protein SufE for iron-sulfur cluster assembly n=1 Tax=Candidatus Similichlamydia laticola TaxID=2170265 RepID=A0A369KG67_9BACT|nr:SufE family protein [Candidatus Similichlamydia laticola]RDB31695.1 Sulfur acceptor protein SufE for iron-sulfur cluster assembly [Candidatus Similichlamydia laticola]
MASPPNPPTKEVEDYFLLCRSRQDLLEKEFLCLPSLHAKYDLLINKGKRFFRQHAPTEPSALRVKGCQSETFLQTHIENYLISFSGQSNALISSGLLCILIEIYSGLPPPVILTCSPDIIKRVGFHEFLSLNRANGLQEIYLHMKEQSVHLLASLGRDSSPL